MQNRFTNAILNKVADTLTGEYQMSINGQVGLLFEGKYGSKIWLNENGTYSTLLVLGKYDTDRGKFAQNDYRELVENLDILDRSGQIRELFDRLQTMADKHH